MDVGAANQLMFYDRWGANFRADGSQQRSVTGIRCWILSITHPHPFPKALYDVMMVAATRVHVSSFPSSFTNFLNLHLNPDNHPHLFSVVQFKKTQKSRKSRKIERSEILRVIFPSTFLSARNGL